MGIVLSYTNTTAATSNDKLKLRIHKHSKRGGAIFAPKDDGKSIMTKGSKRRSENEICQIRQILNFPHLHHHHHLLKSYSTNQIIINRMTCQLTNVQKRYDFHGLVIVASTKKLFLNIGIKYSTCRSALLSGI